MNHVPKRRQEKKPKGWEIAPRILPGKVFNIQEG